ncbi:MAG: GDSL-type esterase/lipase family protein [Flavobacteriaceae bacterium]
MKFRYLIIFISLNFLNSQSQNLFPNVGTEIMFQPEWAKKLYYERIELFKQDTLKFNQIVFLGNSITEGGKDWNEKFGVVGISNRGISGDSTDGVIARLNEIIHFSPKAIFLLIGINDIYNELTPSTDYVSNNILKIIKRINQELPQTKIFLQTILPVEKEVYKDKIIAVNEMIKTFVSQSKFEIIDLYSIFVNKEGKMKKELSYDGVHLNDKGYQVWVDHIKPTVLNLVNHN